MLAQKWHAAKTHWHMTKMTPRDPENVRSHNQMYSWNLLDENPIRLHGGSLRVL